MKILIKNGTLVDPANGINAKADVLIDMGKIAKIGKKGDEAGAEVIEAEGKLVVPGLIDMHTHLREPGREDKETIETGLKAAVQGGFTTVCAMPNTEPPCDNQAQVEFLLGKTSKAKMANLVPIGTITKGRLGKEISEMSDLKDAGVPAVSDDGDSVKDAGVMRRALEYASMLDLLVITHCEEKALVARGVMREGYWSTVLGLSPIPAQAESIIVDRDIRLAALAGARLHIAHISTAESVEMVRQAKKRGVNVTAEVTPHHITLRDQDLKTYDTNMKVNPPLATEEDVEALKKGLQDGTIDVIATDHAPHLESEKEKEFDCAPFGMIGLETALALSAEVLVGGGYLGWPELIEKMSANPSRILQLHKGTLAEGAVADITIIDPEKEWVYEKKNIRSRSLNSPFIGRKMKAKVTDVLVNGKIVLRNEKLAV